MVSPPTAVNRVRSPLESTLTWSSGQAVPVVDDQVRPPHLPAAESGELQWQAVDRGVETSAPTWLPIPNGPASPMLQYQAGTVRA